MNETPVAIRRALVSVSDKRGLPEFAAGLHAHGIEIISTGGTANLLREHKIPVTDVSHVTQFPEMMDGRVKTLHPKIHGGILGLREQHAEIAIQHGIAWIDLVIVNLYPFAETIQRKDVTFDEAIENIDIGGPAMIRSAAKNMGWVGVVVSPDDYDFVLDELAHDGTLSFAARHELAERAFDHTATYDRMICDYLGAGNKSIQLEKSMDLRYGENPHQTASAFHIAGNTHGVLSAKQHQGKELSYNNIVDADAALACVNEFAGPACVIVKHATPCGVAEAENINEAFARALAADRLSAFGGIVALNQKCTEEIAQALSGIFMEVLIAPDYSPAALKLLANKKDLRVLEMHDKSLSSQEMKFVNGGVLIQSRDNHQLSSAKLQTVTNTKVDAQTISELLFAWQVVKHVKSNAIVLARDLTTLGIGTGQVSRVDAVRIAMQKAGDNLTGAVLASDAFFPFRDGIDLLAGKGIKAIIQPGGSVRDQEVIDACNEHGIAMVFTGVRCFKH